MTSAATTTTPPRWNEALVHFAHMSAELASAEIGNEDDHPAESAAKHAAWLGVFANPAPDVEALALKLGMMVAGAVAEDTGGSIDNLDDLQWMLDDATREDSAGHLVMLWQDALRLTGDDHPVLALSPISAKDWRDVVARYRQALSAYLATVNAHSDDIPDDVAEEAERLIRPIYNGMLRWPVSSVEQLAEKGELIALDCRDELKALQTLTADAARISKL